VIENKGLAKKGRNSNFVLILSQIKTVPVQQVDKLEV
jgi:hypothetical protein